LNDLYFSANFGSTTSYTAFLMSMEAFVSAIISANEDCLLMYYN